MKRVVFAGLPESGKSTFLAALSHQLLNGGAQTAFTFEKFSDQEGRLRALEERWLAVKCSERTKTDTESWVALHVKRVAGGERVTFEIPDLRGEHFEHPAVRSTCEPRLWSALKEANGIVLFTNGGRRRDDVSIDEITALLHQMGEPAEEDVSDEASESEVDSLPPFDPQNMPEEVKLVELLQAINRGDARPSRRRIAVVISAWDLCGSDLTPDAWLERERPMLSQFLMATTDCWTAKVYGVSAQGGELPKDAERLHGILNPAERVMVTVDGPPAHDLTAILDWVAVQLDE